MGRSNDLGLGGIEERRHVDADQRDVELEPEVPCHSQRRAIPDERGAVALQRCDPGLDRRAGRDLGGPLLTRKAGEGCARTDKVTCPQEGPRGVLQEHRGEDPEAEPGGFQPCVGRVSIATLAERDEGGHVGDDRSDLYIGAIGDHAPAPRRAGRRRSDRRAAPR